MYTAKSEIYCRIDPAEAGFFCPLSFERDSSLVPIIRVIFLKIILILGFFKDGDTFCKEKHPFALGSSM